MEWAPDLVPDSSIPISDYSAAFAFLRLAHDIGPYRENGRGNRKKSRTLNTDAYPAGAANATSSTGKPSLC
jgi:hypothetical protein